MLVMYTLQSLTFLAVLLAVAFLGARITTDAERHHMVRTTTSRRVPLEHLLARPEPMYAPTAHLRPVWSRPDLPNDEPYDQMKDLAN